MGEPSAKPRSGMVAIIPARKGSKRLPEKNLLLLGGKPLIRWTIDAAEKSGVFDHIAVTSDDSRILEQARGANTIPIVRPPNLATDTATSADVVLHALEVLEKQGIRPLTFMLLQPTSPMRTADDIRKAVDLMAEKSSDSIVSVCLAEHSPLWCGTLESDMSMHAFLKPSVHGQRGQDLPTYYRLNGAIYLAKVEAFRDEKTFFTRNSHAYVMPVDRSVDIDTSLDFKLAQCLCGEPRPPSEDAPSTRK